MGLRPTKKGDEDAEKTKSPVAHARGSERGTPNRTATVRESVLFWAGVFNGVLPVVAVWYGFHWMHTNTVFDASDSDCSCRLMHPLPTSLAVNKMFTWSKPENDGCLPA
jgi:hypothetical protein